MDNLSAAARRAITSASAVIRSPGWMFGHYLFAGMPDIQQNLPAICEELVAEGYLTRTYMLSKPSEDYPDDAELSSEDAAELKRCIAEQDVFVHPESGEELIPPPGSLLTLYFTTDKMPTTAPPPDERAMALRAAFASHCDQAAQAEVKAAWQQALDLLTLKFQLPVPSK